MKVSQAEIDEMLRILTETAGKFLLVSNRLTDDRLITRPDPDAWSANDILAHLHACADVSWGRDIQAMLEQDARTLRHISPRTYIRKTNYPALEFSTSLQQFIDQRNIFLHKLKLLETDGWSRGAEIENRQHTVFSHVRKMAQHEFGHWQQFKSLFLELLQPRPRPAIEYVSSSR